MISHTAAIHNTAGIDQSIRGADAEPLHQWADALVSWLPLHHDMGLIGNLLTSIVTGVDLWLFPSSVFLARPRLWLAELGKRGRTAAHGPNFGYQLCVERLPREARAGLDLSKWEAAQTGAEMVRPETMSAFVQAFAPFGFRAEALRPSYGLAEATVGVTMDQAGVGVRTRRLPELSQQGGETDQEVVCVGSPFPDTELRVTDPAGNVLGADTVGEVRVRTPSLMMGYLDDPEATAEVLVDGWHRTGDLGFLYDGELYLTGRLKDIIIVRGTNFMPHEIEWLAEGASGGGGSFRSGAFSVAHGSEGEVAVLVVEAGERDESSRREMKREIRLRVAHDLGIDLADVVFVRRGRIPRTTSGKVQRRELQQMYADGRLIDLGDRRSA